MDARKRARLGVRLKNSYILGGIALGVIVLALLVFFLVRHHARQTEAAQQAEITARQTEQQENGEAEQKPAEDTQPTEDTQPAEDDTDSAEPSSDISADTVSEQTDGVWNLVLVNPWNPLPEDSDPPLCAIEDLPSYDNMRIDSRCYPQLKQMVSDCAAVDGCSPFICSAYRTWDTQQSLFDAQVEAFGGDEEKAAREVAVPGTSEHQLGLAVDIIDTCNWNLDDSQESTPTQQWLMQNCWRYGFILRYPNGSTDITGIIYEPWHYRYVGLAVAEEMHQSGVTLEEYLGRASH